MIYFNIRPIVKGEGVDAVCEGWSVLTASGPEEKDVAMVVHGLESYESALLFVRQHFNDMVRMRDESMRRRG